MKKNISINISGIIFHIEEDGYEKLKDYLDAIGKYFAGFEDSKEIVEDIESRIAEKFLARLSKSKQVITPEDVDNLIAEMGTVSDFQQVEEEDSRQQKAGPPPPAADNQAAGKRLYRDTRRKMLGGVAAGIAHYFRIDPVWIRLLFILTLFDFFLTFSISTLSLLAYLLLWLVVPGNDQLEDDQQVKKMYRNPQNRVIGGVASGVAAYFNVDVTLIRILFVILIFLGGSGLIAYLVLWIALPEARTITDQMQMKGEPLTLENIESSLKNTRQNTGQQEEESTLVKVLLFPFRLLASLLRGLARILGPVALFILEALRLVAGITLILVGLVMLISLFLTSGVFLGLWGGSGLMHILDIPTPYLFNLVSPLAFFTGAVATGIPALGLILLGLATLLKRKVISATAGWSLLAIWLLSLLAFGFAMPATFGHFRSHASHTETRLLPAPAGKLLLGLQTPEQPYFDRVTLQLRGHEGPGLRLEQRYQARGRTRNNALAHARNIRYEIVRQDSLLLFPAGFTLPDEAGYYNQKLDLTLYIPYGLPFEIDEETVDIIRNTFNHQGYRTHLIGRNTWVFNPSGLDCLTCTDLNKASSQRRERYEELFRENLERGHNDRPYPLRDFGTINLSGPFRLNLVPGDDYRVVLNGNDHDLENTRVTATGNRLMVTYDEESPNLGRQHKITVKIVSPRLDSLILQQSAEGEAAGFGLPALYVSLSDLARLDLSVEADTLITHLQGSSQLNLFGQGKVLQARVTMASLLHSYAYFAEKVNLITTGAAKARVYASDRLQVTASLISDVKYRGGARVTRIKTSAMGRVTSDNNEDE